MYKRQVLVQRDGEHPGVVPERLLDAVAVVDVHVDVGDPLGAEFEQPGDGERRVVVDAEAGRAVGHRVVQAAGEVDGVRGLPAPDGFGGGDRLAGDQRGGGVEGGEGPVVVGAEAVPRVLPVGVGGGPLDRLDVRRGVHQAEGGVARGGRGADGDTRPGGEAEVLDQAHGERQPGGIHRVARAEVVGGDRLVPEEVQAAGGVTLGVGHGLHRSG